MSAELIVLGAIFLSLLITFGVVKLGETLSKREMGRVIQKIEIDRQCRIKARENLLVEVMSIEELAHLYDQGFLPLDSEFNGWVDDLYKARISGQPDPSWVQYKLKIGEYAGR